MEKIGRTKIVDLLKRTDIGAMVNVKGWVRTRRGSKQVNFIALNDGSTINNLQIVVDLANFDEEMLKLITTGACISVNGEMVESVGSGQKVEVQAREIEVLGTCDNTYPLQKKGHSMEFLREIAHLRPRTNTFGAVFRIRHNMAIAIHKFFHEKGFFYFHTPIITASDCEGAGQMFQVTTMNLYDLKKDERGSISYEDDFFGKQASLTVSGQLEGELAATALGAIYTFGPTFRAENSNTPRHLAEFWMIEPEVAFNDIADNMDLYLRAGRKGPGAWCGTFRDQSYKDGERVVPVVYIVANFTRPNGTIPALLDLDETTTFFHEFGHALHLLFSDVPYRGLLAVENDFVELPSQIMENWATEPEMLRSYAIHWQTGKVIPENLIKRIQESALFNQGFETVELAAASYSDMELHDMEEYVPVDLDAFEKRVLNEERGLIPQIEPRYRYPYFSHIFDGGYSAGYYGYLWAEVLDKDAYEAFRETGELFNKKVAARFREEILSKGGTEDGMVLYENFRGRQPSRLPLLVSRGLVEEPAANGAE